MKKHIAILCGGVSYEHEVSIISGIQIAENIDTEKYSFSFVYYDQHGVSWLIKNFKKRIDFLAKKRVKADLLKCDDGVYLVSRGLIPSKSRVDACYLAFHGGSGEAGPVQGMLEVLQVPFTSPSQEGSVIAMNKSVTKEVLRDHTIPVLDSITVFSGEYQEGKEAALESVKERFDFPVILKPVHLGSSIAIEIAENEVELEKFLNVATRVDNEILIEPALTDFTEYNVSVRSYEGCIECSPIEEPKRSEEILSFDDKYEKGSKKTGKGNSDPAGMASLERTVPAQISEELKTEIHALAKRVYRAARLSGLVRIDFLYHENKLYCTEINPIPGSLSFYLWEPTGEQFSEQITKSIEDAEQRFDKKIDVIPYESSIVEKFVNS